MPGAARLGDVCTGHGDCFKSRKNIQGSPDVFVDNLPCHRVSDHWDIHGSNDCGFHGGVLATGSNTVFTNNLPQGRIGDAVNCGSIVATGSDSVFID